MKKVLIYVAVFLICGLGITSLTFAITGLDKDLTEETVSQEGSITTKEIYSETINDTTIVQTTNDEITYFDLVLLSDELLDYNAMAVIDRVYSVQSFDESLLENLSNIYSPNIEFTMSEALSNSWEEINDDTMFILGDVLVTDNFDTVGICVGDEEIFVLNNGEIASPHDFEYINLDFQTKVLIGSEELKDEEDLIKEEISNEIIDKTTNEEIEYFDLFFLDEVFLNYSPLETLDRVYSVQSFDEPLLDNLSDIYSPSIEFTISEAQSNSWEEINSDTMLILGDILVTENFDTVGICVGEEEIFVLNNGEIVSPQDFKYINLDFQTKTLNEVW